MNFAPVILAAASFVVSKDELTELAEHYGYVGDMSETHFKNILEERKVSVNQAALIYHSCFLYCALACKTGAGLDGVRKKLGLPKSVFMNSLHVIVKKRVDFIRDDLKKQNKPFISVFVDNEDYIEKMLVSAVAEEMPDDRKILTNLASFEYEHPTDRAYLNRLNTNKVIEKIIKLYSEYNFERIIMVQYTGSNIRVTEKNIPYLYNALKTVCEVLDVKEVPPLYVAPGSLNAMTIGSAKPVIVISGICLSLLSYDELLFILGHEVGHIKSQHVLYHSIGNFIPYIAGIIGNLTLGIGELAVKGVLLLLYQWYRMSEITADRAGLLACQNIDAAVSVMAKLSGYPPSCYSDIDNDVFLEQAVEFEDLDKNTFDKLLKLFSVLYKSHPWTIMRAKELRSWYDNGDYARVYNTTERKKVERKPQNIVNSIFDKDMFCANCGKKITSASRFCEFCGKENIYYK